MTRAIFYRCLSCLLFVLSLRSAVPVTAQLSSGHIIHLKSGDITTPANARQWLEGFVGKSSSAEPLQVLVHFSALPTADQRSVLQESGISLFDYLPDNTYLATITAATSTSQILSTPLYSITETRPEWKADAAMWRRINKAQGAVEVLVSFLPTIDAGAIRQFVSRVGGRIDPGTMERYGSYKVVIAASAVHAMAEWYGVQYISPVTDIAPLDNESLPAVRGNIATAPVIYGGYGLTGDSVTVGVGDNASGIYHADTKERVINFNPAGNVHHGELVNGIVGGAASIDPFSTSIAPHCNLVDHLFDLILPVTGAMYHDFNMTITNNSYTIIERDCDYDGTYDAYSRLLDTLAIQYPNVQHVFAAGNDGTQACDPYPLGFATVGGGYQPAKNNIVVGSMTDFLVQADDESRGPVKDGRLKPEIIAIGLGPYATLGIDGYAWTAGTSMSSPQVAGGLAALTQRYKNQNGGTQLRADLLKAILLNGAMDLGNPGPDYSYGFGGMDMYHSLQIIDNKTYITNTMNTGDVQPFDVIVPANTGLLKVMLYWNDVPASPSAATALVNDLDLVVTTPSLVAHRPLGLDPLPGNVNNNAVEKVDHINNVEQVTIATPLAGTYHVSVTGFSIPQGPQQYVVVYESVPNELRLTYPIGGEQLTNGSSNLDSIRVFWDAISDGNTFTVELSTNNGASWTTVANAVPPDIRYCSFLLGGINSGNCLVRVSRPASSQVAVSGRFAVNTQPVVQLDTSQCPGYVNIHWSPVPNATSYQLWKKKGLYMQVVDSTTDTLYSYSGMSLTEKSYVSVQPVINGMKGCRSVAAIVVANSGNCTNVVSSGDIMAEKIIAPSNGRMFTSSGFTATTPVRVQLRNLYSMPCASYSLSCKVNSGAWQVFTNPGTIPAAGTTVISIPGLSFATPGTYNITIAVHNTGVADPQHGNDTLAFTLLNLPNAPLNLGTSFLDDFESMGPFSVSHDSVGVSPNGHWDYFNADDSGRMRSFVADNVTISGNRSVSLDENQTVIAGSNNAFVGTFNLGSYDTATAEIRVDFDYILHGTPKSPEGNIVNARGADTASWLPFFSYDLNAFPGFLAHVKSLSLTDVVRRSKHNFSPGTQISFGQSDTSLVAAVNYGNGITIDNFRLYTVANDASVANVVSPLPTNCGLPASVPLTVSVCNGVNYTLYNVHMNYSMDGGTVYQGVIDSIRAKDTVLYTFAQPLAVAPASTHVLNIWLTEAGDTYTANDTIANYHFRNSRIITSYPYLENFESGDGGYFSDGFLDSWQYGTPASPHINKAASGTKAWKTNLPGNYNNLEKSYLYSPCFDISQLSNPMLSFSAAFDIENCGGTLCDAGYIEYSFDGASWSKLGNAGVGTNWYDSTFDVWNTEGFTRWHVASIPLPQPPAGETIHFRFVMAADPGTTFEGMAIDDIHVYDLFYPILSGISASVKQDLTASQWTDYVHGNQLLASVQPVSGAVANILVSQYAHDTLCNPGATQFTFPRSYTVKAPQGGTPAAIVRLYLTDDEFVAVLNDTTCPSCSPVTDAYSLGITRYANTNNIAAENSTLNDDTGGSFTFYPHNSIAWVPYDKGYYAELSSPLQSELWFNDGGPTAVFPAGVDYLNFVAFKTGQNATIYWYSLIDTVVGTYTLQRSIDGISFNKILDTAATHTNPGEYSYYDPVNITASTTLYYRLMYTIGVNTYYSPVRKVDYTDNATNLVTLNAEMIDHQRVLVNWKSFIDGIATNYILERSVDAGSFTAVDNTSALRHYGQQYDFIDFPSFAIPPGSLVHYRLTVNLQNGLSVTLPVCTLKWYSDKSVVEIYPNPTHDGSFSISWHADAGTRMNINICDAVGRSVYETGVTAMQWNNVATFKSVDMPRGVYFVRMDIGGSRHVEKLVCE